MSSLKNKITAIKAGKNPRIQRSNIFLDGKFAFSLDNEVIVKECLKVGNELSEQEKQLLAHEDSFQRCLNAAFRLLGYRPRSEREIKERLSQKGYLDQDIEKTISKLKNLNLINDTEFAEFWKENRNSFRPRGQRMIKVELKRKGIESEVINQVVGSLDDTQNAYQAAQAKVRTLPLTDYNVFRQKLSGYLQRRGFDYVVINKTVKQIWQEHSPNSDSSSGANS